MRKSLKINFKELDSRHQSQIIAIYLRQSDLEEVKNFFEELKLEKNVLKDYAGVICDSYHSVVAVKDAEEFKRLILAKRDESKLITESKVAIRALVREKNIRQSEERKTELEEQIAIVKEKLAQYEEKLEATDGRIFNRLSRIQENTTFTSNSVLMGERITALNINYETLCKHASADTYKYYLQDIMEKSTISNCKAYQDLMLIALDASGEILAERDSTNSTQISATQNPTSNSTQAASKLNRRLQKDLSAIDSYIFDNQELIKLKRCDLLEIQRH